MSARARGVPCTFEYHGRAHTHTHTQARARAPTDMQFLATDGDVTVESASRYPKLPAACDRTVMCFEFACARWPIAVAAAACTPQTRHGARSHAPYVRNSPGARAGACTHTRHACKHTHAPAATTGRNSGLRHANRSKSNARPSYVAESAPHESECTRAPLLGVWPRGVRDLSVTVHARTLTHASANQAWARRRPGLEARARSHEKKTERKKEKKETSRALTGARNYW